MVDAYIRDYRRSAADEFSFFRGCSAPRDAIREAALARRPDGKRHSHQRRIPRRVLAEGEANLQACLDELARCGTFTEVHALVERELLDIRGIGPLTVYDVAARIGAHFGLEPDRIHLHAGTAEGARALGFSRRRILDPAELPHEFRTLRPREIEDCLCIYKRELAAMARAG